MTIPRKPRLGVIAAFRNQPDARQHNRAAIAATGARARVDSHCTSAAKAAQTAQVQVLALGRREAAPVCRFDAPRPISAAPSLPAGPKVAAHAH